MRRVIWSEPAEADLLNIRAYIGQFSPLAAQRLAIRIRQAGESLDEFPEQGRATIKGRRELVIVRPYVILYRVTEDVVYILRVRHGARRPLVG